MNETLWLEAEKLANELYDFTVETDDLSNGQLIYLLRHPDLPGCIAQGISISEAKSNLDAARVDYIYDLLVSGLNVPVSSNS